MYPRIPLMMVAALIVALAGHLILSRDTVKSLLKKENILAIIWNHENCDAKMVFVQACKRGTLATENVSWCEMVVLVGRCCGIVSELAQCRGD
jgi:poly-beta-hydroxyalkanoate depolymerase